MDAVLTIAFPPGVTIGKWTRVFAERNRRVRLDVRPVDSANGPDALADPDVDLAFVRLPVESAHLHVIPLYVEDVMVALAEEHLLTLEDRIAWAQLGDENLLDGIPDEAMFRAVAAGAGVAVMPASIAKSLRRRDVVVRRVEDAEPAAVALAWRRDRENPMIDEFIGIVRGRTANSSRGRAS